MNAQKPTRILFFDGNCGLCTRSVRLLFKFDRHRRIHCAPLQGLTSSRSLPEEFREASNISTVVYLEENHGTQRLYIRSRAVCAILIEMGGIPRVLGKSLLIIPVFLRDGTYKVIAKYRNILFPASTCLMLTCRMTDPVTAISSLSTVHYLSKINWGQMWKTAP